MKSKDFNAYINQQSIRYLEKKDHYFEKSPSHDAQDILGTIEAS